MGWVNDALRELTAGRPAHVRPIGGSMRGRIESGQVVTIAPVDPGDVRPDDVVLVVWKGNHLLHLVREATAEQLLIGNNLGKTNGWVPRSAVAGRVTDVRDDPAPGRVVTPAEVAEHVCGSVERFCRQHPAGNEKSWADLRDRLLRWVRTLGPPVACEGLLRVLERDGGYEPQFLAGELLAGACPSCTVPLDEVLRRVVPALNPSASTVPQYLAAVFGRDAVVGRLRVMAGDADGADAAGKIRTMRWWLKDVTDSGSPT